MAIGELTLVIHIEDCHSLKEKRSFTKPLISKLQKSFNLSVAETGFLENWSKCQISCVIVSNSSSHAVQVLQKAIKSIESNNRNFYIEEDHIQLL